MQEQGEAAGGASMRLILLEDGSVVRAAVLIRVFARTLSKKYAYLQFKHAGKTITRYLCPVVADTREEALWQAWSVLNKIPIFEKFGWSWVTHRGVKR